MVIAEPGVPQGLPEGRPALLRWTDSLVGDALVNRAPEVKWVLPDELRRTARRSGGLVQDPDQMGQAIMRPWGLSIVPDPLRSYLRRLAAVSGGGSIVMIPALVIFRPTTDGKGFHVELSAVMADVRTGRVVWRTVAPGDGETAAVALERALVTMLPIEGGGGA